MIGLTDLLRLVKTEGMKVLDRTRTWVFLMLLVLLSFLFAMGRKWMENTTGWEENMGGIRSGQFLPPVCRAVIDGCDRRGDRVQRICMGYGEAVADPSGKPNEGPVFQIYGGLMLFFALYGGVVPEFDVVRCGIVPGVLPGGDGSSPGDGSGVWIAVGGDRDGGHDGVHALHPVPQLLPGGGALHLPGFCRDDAGGGLEDDRDQSGEVPPLCQSGSHTIPGRGDPGFFRDDSGFLHRDSFSLFSAVSSDFLALLREKRYIDLSGIKKINRSFKGLAFDVQMPISCLIPGGTEQECMASPVC